jgi:hypothetical protein
VGVLRLDRSSRGSKLGGGGEWERQGSTVARLSLAALEVEERADRQGPYVSKGREKRRRGRKARFKEENTFFEIRQGFNRSIGLGEGCRDGLLGRLGQLG